MTDVQTASVISTFGVNGVVFLVFTVLFELVRSRAMFEDVFAPKTKWNELNGTNRISPKAGVFSWIKQVCWEISDAQALHQVGMDGYVALRFLRMMAVLAGVVSFLALTVLAPLYATAGGSTPADGGNATALEGISLVTMANIPQEGDRLWGPFVCHYLFTFVFIYSLHKEYENFVEKRKAFMKAGGGLVGYSVLIESIPKNCTSIALLTKLMEQNFPGKVIATTIAMTCPRLSKLLAERLAICTQLENATGNLSVKTKVPMLRLGACGLVGTKVDAVSHWEGELERINGLITKQQDEAVVVQNGGTSTGSKKHAPSISRSAFVTLSSRKSRDEMIATPILYNDYPDIKVLPAPAPEDIIWPNAPATLLMQQRGITMTNIILCAGLLFWGVIM
jgi:hypothetical protein